MEGNSLKKKKADLGFLGQDVIHGCLVISARVLEFVYERECEIIYVETHKS